MILFFQESDLSKRFPWLAVCKAISKMRIQHSLEGVVIVAECISGHNDTNKRNNHTIDCNRLCTVKCVIL